MWRSGVRIYLPSKHWLLTLPEDYCTVLYCTVLCCAALCCPALHCTVLHCTALHCTVNLFFDPYQSHSLRLASIVARGYQNTDKWGNTEIFPASKPTEIFLHAPPLRPYQGSLQMQDPQTKFPFPLHREELTCCKVKKYISCTWIMFLIRNAADLANYVQDKGQKGTQLL